MAEPTYRAIDRCTKALKEAGVAFESNDRGSHLVVRHNTLVADFYPVTGKFTVRPRHGASLRPTNNLRGVEALITYLGG